MAIQDDLLALFKLLPGGSSTANAAAAKVESFKALIRSEAKKGAEEAIPTIEKKITPMILAALGVGALALLVGIRASMQASRRSLSGHSPRRLRGHR